MLLLYFRQILTM